MANDTRSENEYLSVIGLPDLDSQFNPMKTLDLTKGLHLLKECIQPDAAPEQAKEFLVNLTKCIAVTKQAVPVRNPRAGNESADLFRLHRHLTSEKASLANLTERTRDEDRLEREAWCHWSPSSADPVRGAWERLVTYQMPLQNSRADKAWGKVDLVGMSPEGLPVVVELKGDRSKDPVLKVMIQALAYGIAIQSAWPRLRPHWLKATSHLRSPLQLPKELVRCPLVCAAPDDYWTAALECLDLEARKDLGALATAFECQGFPTRFVKLQRLKQGLSAELFNL